MRIDEARQHHAAVRVKLLRTARQRVCLNLGARADSRYEAIGDEHGAVFYDFDIGEGSAATWSASAQSQNLRSSGDECGDAQGVDSMPEDLNAREGIRLQHGDF
jgi:hypothetical protein